MRRTFQISRIYILAKILLYPLFSYLRHLFASYKLNLKEIPSHGQVWLCNMCARSHGLWEFREWHVEQVAMRGFKQNSWEACTPRSSTGTVPGPRLIQVLRPLPSDSGATDHRGPEVSTVLHKVVRFYWIIDIWMTFNKLIVRRK